MQIDKYVKVENNFTNKFIFKKGINIISKTKNGDSCTCADLWMSSSCLC